MTILESLLGVGFLTGSRAFGTAKFNSDWDVVISVVDMEIVDAMLSGLERVPSNYLNGFVVKVSDEKNDYQEINIIPVHPHEFLPWFLATKAMAASLKISGITDPIKSKSIFMGIVSLYKGMVEAHQRFKDYEDSKKELVKLGTV